MTNSSTPPVRIGILWRGDRTVEAPAPRTDRQLGPLFEAFAKQPVTIVPIPFADDAIDDVRKELLNCDGVLVWVNPIQDGANRARLDPLLRDVSARGVFVSAHPDVILKLGTKEVLFHTRELGWGSDTDLYISFADFAQRFPSRLAERGRLVLKQGRGNGGNGVWLVELREPSGGARPDAIVRIQEARSSGESAATSDLSSFMKRCEQYFEWSGCLVDQEYQERLAEGMIRCYFTHDEVVGFARQWPKGLLNVEPEGIPVEAPPSVMDGPDVPEYQALRNKAETEWIPQMTTMLGLERKDLPVIWDADFFFGPTDAVGDDTYVLCEINVSAVWPFPPTASERVASAALEQVQSAKTARSH